MGENFTLNLTSCQMQDSVMIEDNHPQSPAQFVEVPTLESFLHLCSYLYLLNSMPKYVLHDPITQIFLGLSRDFTA